MGMLQVKRNKILEEQKKAKEFEGSQDQILCESYYTDTQDRLFQMNTTVPMSHSIPKSLALDLRTRGKH